MDLNVLVSVVIEHTNNMPMFFYTYLHPHFLYTVLSRWLYSIFNYQRYTTIPYPGYSIQWKHPHQGCWHWCIKSPTLNIATLPPQILQNMLNSKVCHIDHYYFCSFSHLLPSLSSMMASEDVSSIS
jgi:hypothetical protein